MCIDLTNQWDVGYGRVSDACLQLCWHQKRSQLWDISQEAVEEQDAPELLFKADQITEELCTRQGTSASSQQTGSSTAWYERPVTAIASCASWRTAVCLGKWFLFSTHAGPSCPPPPLSGRGGKVKTCSCSAPHYGVTRGTCARGTLTDPTQTTQFRALRAQHDQTRLHLAACGQRGAASEHPENLFQGFPFQGL